MATNSARGNPIAAADSPVSTPTPPPLSDDIKADARASAAGTDAGMHASGQDAAAAAAAAPAQTKVKSEKELEKERKKAEKLAKFSQKQAAAATAATAAPTAAPSAKAKEKKAARAKPEEEELPPYVEETPAGEKKRLRPLDDPYFKAYNPAAVEAAWNDWWEKEGFFQPEFTADGKVKPAGSFVIPHPPPNVTGNLHIGHSLGDSLQDLLIRWNRMQGKTVAWIPGCDHAGISTQSVVEKMLWRRRKQTRHDLGREKFVETVMSWKDEYHVNINKALRMSGYSLDWTREAFTMDENLSAAVRETFVTLFDEGTIYRANRLVNHCCALNTALSNLEVENVELDGRTMLDVPGYDKKIEFGVMHYFYYPIEGTEEKIEVGTTRIETMVGDTGIAVHPEDDRYKHLVGKTATHPFIPGRLLPIVADDTVERELGTGAVKLTPAHDANDFARGQRHNLEFINILTDDGLLNENAGVYKGMKRFDARYKIVDDLTKLGLYHEKKPNPMKVPVCEKTKDIIEARLKPQWWVKMEHLAADAVKAVKAGEIKIRPEAAEQSFYRWMDNINDWCISRQLWWGHRAPIYFADIEGEESDRSDGARWFAGRTRPEAEEKANAALPGKKFTLHQDEDVLDTWFSSGLWPFSTLGWPNKNAKDLQTLYPTSLLECGWDILFFWVARQIMLGIKMTGQVPFREVFCHSLIRDSDGRKMSKSLGNVIAPEMVLKGVTLEELHQSLRVGNLAESEISKAEKYQKQAFPQGIPACGADALRFTMISYTSNSGDINLDVKVLAANRRFVNKIWQASKYVLGKLDTIANFKPRDKRTLGGKENLAEKWIMHRMNTTAKVLNEALTEREFMRSANLIYKYIYAELCDVFIENSKSIIQDGTPEEQESAAQTLYNVLEAALLLTSPFMPFVTEELWQRLPRRAGETAKSIMFASYPQHDPALDNAEAAAAYELVMGCSRGVRSLMAEYALRDEAQVFIQTYDATSHATVTEQVASIRSLSGKGVTALGLLTADAVRPAGCVAFPVSGSAAVFLHVKGRVDLDAEIDKAAKKLDKARTNIDKTRKLIADPGYQEKVAAATQEAELKRLADLEAEARGFEGTIRQFEQLKLE